MKFTRVEKDNWKSLQNRSLNETTEYRDVFSEQQLERTQMEAPQNPFTRLLATVVLTLLVSAALWSLISILEFVIAFVTSRSGSGSTSLVLVGASGASSLPPIQYFFGPSLIKIVIVFIVTVAFFTVVYSLLMRNLDLQNALSNTSDINSYMNDQHVQVPEEMMRNFDFFPDAGGHSSVQVSSMISHVALSNKGLNKVPFVDRQAAEDDDSEFYAILEGATDELTIVKRPWIDEKFRAALFEASGVPQELWKFYDATQIPYNPGNKNRDKLKGYDTVADMINGDWELPLYETQMPGGAYIVDTAPVNTMVLAITRAGKGQTVIEPTIDMWLREKEPNNIVINDPKGELLVKNYVPATVRGFQVVQFNLINALKTDIYNPLAMAAQAAREGDSNKCALYVENIAEVFFPLDGGEDPVWPNAANNAFKRAAYGLIDYYMEEERQLRKRAMAQNMNPGVLETKIDELWGKVTLYNCYQLFVQLTAKKVKDPALEFDQEFKKYKEEPPGTKGKFAGKDAAWVNAEYERVAKQRELWEGAQEVDQLTLYFSATDKLPSNSMRTLVRNANNALKAMGGADKMLASVYGIAITAMSFFTDPTISTLTSGTLSQNVDLGGMSFPRRVAVRLHPEFCRRYHLIGLQARWQAYSDPEFKNSLGKDFYHEDLVTREGWARFMFKGIVPGKKAYFKLELLNPQTSVLVKSFYFEFEKSHQKSLDGRFYVADPILDEKIVKNGILTELRPRKKQDGSICYVHDKLTFHASEIHYENGDAKKVDVMTPAIILDTVRYSEKPKIVFLVTPPHLMKYAKLILILIKQLVDLNFDSSYMTKPDQHPLYKTRFMLDELGNLQSEGHGISGFETMLSIGLGQDQQFTLILQTLQQLRDVYGESVDKIVQGNAQPLHSKIATPTGWKTMGEMEVGTEVLTPAGKKSQVIGVYPRGVRKVYRVRTRDGRECLVCNEHLWKVRVQ